VKRFVAFLVAVSAVIVLVPTAASAKTGTLTGLYNERYCEIFAVTMPDPPSFSVDVYNTVGLSDCPAEEWNAVDFTAVKEETGSLAGRSERSPALADRHDCKRKGRRAIDNRWS